MGQEEELASHAGNEAVLTLWRLASNDWNGHQDARYRWEGNANIKGLHVFKVTDKPYQSRQSTARYTDLVCQDGACHARQFTFVMDAKFVIIMPSVPYPQQRGFVEIRGWLGQGAAKS